MNRQPRAFRFFPYALAEALLVLVSQALGGCGQTVEVGTDDAATGGASIAGSGGGGGTLSVGGLNVGGANNPTAGAQAQGGVPGCTETLCRGKRYACGDCVDNDQDGKVDAEDPDCLGPCDNDEQSLRTGLTVGNAANCRQDCYFDGDAGPGNDKCSWTHQCDTLSVAPDYPPSGEARCAYDASKGCGALLDSQPAECIDTCLPLVPNGCDCFGCCELPPGSNVYYFLGSTRSGSGCELDAAGDPSNCPRCTPVPSCRNPCEKCENCVGRGPDPECAGSIACPPGQAACTSNSQCDYQEYCVTGCCVAAPEPT